MFRKINIDWNFVLSKAVTIGPKALVAVYILKVCYGLLEGGGWPGGDFFYYWWASYLAREGNASMVYNFHGFQEVLKTVSGTEFPIAWFYPPTFLLVILPLSFLPYLLSLLTWISITFLAYYRVILRIAPHPLSTWLILAFPATLLNVSYGQNGFLSAALIGGGLLLVDDRPYVAGLLFGLLTYKPQLAVLVPIALVAGRHWRALLAFFFSVGFMLMFSSMLLGLDTWTAFWKNISIAVTILESGYEGHIQNWGSMISVFSSARLAGLTLSAARILQGTAMCAVLVIVVWVWFKRLPLHIRASVLTLGALLFSPHAFAYDLTLLALAIAWIGWEGYTKGWMPGERAMLSVAWFTPLLSTFLVTMINVQLTPVLLIAFLICVLRRVYHPTQIQLVFAYAEDSG